MANTHSIDIEASSSQYLTSADSASLGISGNLTVELWIKPESLPTTNNAMVLMEKGLGAGNVENYSLRLFNNGGTQTIQFFTYSDALGFHGVTYTNTLSLDTWVHLAGRYDGTTWKIFKDGTEVASANDTQAPIDNSTSLGIGARGADNVQHFDGKIDDVRIWNVARTSGEISANKSVELVGTETGLAAYWKLNNSLLDETSNNNDLTNNNSAVFSTDVPFTGATTNSNFFQLFN